MSLAKCLNPSKVLFFMIGVGSKEKPDNDVHCASIGCGQLKSGHLSHPLDFGVGNKILPRQRFTFLIWLISSTMKISSVTR